MKKGLKIAALCVALLLIVTICVFANGLVGNPVSKILATRTAKEHLREQYAGTDFFIEDVNFDAKRSGYYARVKAPNSIDRHFTIYLGMDGALNWDTYEDCVINRQNTADRLDRDYRELADAIFESPVYPFGEDITFGEIEFLFRNYDVLEGPPTYGIEKEELVLDKLYDIRELGARAGHLVVYVSDENVSVERAVEVLLELKQLMDSGGVPFYAIDFILCYPQTEDGNRKEGQVGVRNFLYADIYEDGLDERVRVANEALKEYYEKLADEKEADEEV